MKKLILIMIFLSLTLLTGRVFAKEVTADVRAHISGTPVFEFRVIDQQYVSSDDNGILLAVKCHILDNTLTYPDGAALVAGRLSEELPFNYGTSGDFYMQLESIKWEPAVDNKFQVSANTGVILDGDDQTLLVVSGSDDGVLDGTCTLFIRIYFNQNNKNTVNFETPTLSFTPSDNV